MRKLAIAFGVVATSGVFGHVQAQPANRGSLLIVGGGPRADDVARRFVELAGGASGKILIFPMSSSEPESSGKASQESWREFGIAAEFVVLTRDQAMTADTSAMFRGVSGIWFSGGDQSRLTAALLATPVETAIRTRYRYGAVVGGTSAGAAVMSEIMITGDEKRFGGKRPPSDSTQAFITIDRDNVVTTRGFGLVPGAIVDQHFVRRRRHNRLISLVLEHPTLIGAGIDESTAIEVQPNGVWRVWGESTVLIYDPRPGSVTGAKEPLSGRDLRLHVLPAGSVFDPRTGKATLPASPH